MRQLALQIIKRDISRAIHDSVFKMLFDMTQVRFENNILVPILEEIEQSVSGSVYDHYFKTLVCGASMFNSDDKSEYILLGINLSDKELERFVFEFVRYYEDASNEA